MTISTCSVTGALALDVCHMEAFKMRPESTEAALEIQAEFM
jgi:hypothetical protein